jgi:hypothetical protein
MSFRNEVEQRFIVDGRPVIIKLINNPTIDDVVVTEARVYATSIERGNVDPNRRVSRGLRDFLIRLGVER